jgi:hypothetical protein
MLSGPLGIAGGGPVLSTAGPHPVLVAFAAVQTLAMTTVSVAALRVRAARAEPALQRAA